MWHQDINSGLESTQISFVETEVEVEVEDIIETEDHPVPLHNAPGTLKTLGHHIRERMAAVPSAPALFPQHLQEHHYL